MAGIKATGAEIAQVLNDRLSGDHACPFPADPRGAMQLAPVAAAPYFGRKAKST